MVRALVKARLSGITHRNSIRKGGVTGKTGEYLSVSVTWHSAPLLESGDGVRERGGKRSVGGVGQEGCTGAKVPLGKVARRVCFTMSSDKDVERGSKAIPEGREALLLIDLQRAFTTGSWAQWFGVDQCEPIRQAISRTHKLLLRFQDGTLAPPSMMLTTRCPYSGSDFKLDYEVSCLEDTPFVIKPSTNVMLAEGFHAWMLSAIQTKGIKTLVVGGCTTTSCVRVSSAAVQKEFANQGLQVVVDLSLCGAREDNYLPTADLDPVLRKIYGEEACKGRSAVDLAVLQMRSAGVQVVESYTWKQSSHTSP
mmetsp:Transcript_29829/g.65190  ORF Transcript_29829/g.65190 Transcript_29829/m.65190 type:complete len:309 (-) Transcript_29829:88-1014(-)